MVKRSKRTRLKKIASNRENIRARLARQTAKPSFRHRAGQVLGTALLPVVIFIFGMLPFLTPVFVFFLLLLFFLKPTQEVRNAPLPVVLWTMVVFPLLATGFAAPFRGITVTMGGILGRFPIPWSDKMRMFLAPMPADMVIGTLGSVLAAICGSFAMSTLRTQRQQLENIPTATVRSAAIGLTELKGTARVAPGPAHKMRVDAFHPGEPGLPYSIPEERILQTEKRWTGNAIGHRNMWRTFYLEDGTGRMLVDPMNVEFWKGDGSPYFEPLRKIHLAGRIERRFLNPLPEETRWLEDGDPVTVIGSVEMNPEAPPDSVDAERLVVRPSTEQRTPGLIERFVIPGFIGKEFVPGRNYYHLFYLSDTDEDDLMAITKKAEQRVRFWTLAWLGLSLWLAAAAWTEFFR
jgi:hypothetical protein